MAICHDAVGFPIVDGVAYERWLGSPECRDLRNAVDGAGGWFSYVSSTLPRERVAALTAEWDRVSALPRRDDHVAKEIALDVPRTAPYHARESQIKQGLCNLLHAFALHNPKVGYCQGMNFIAALLLSVMTENQAFVVLAYVVDDLLPDYYEGMTGAVVDKALLDWLLEQSPSLDKVALHLEGIGATLLMWQWLICVFANTLPPEAVLALLPAIFEHGRVFLYRLLLALVSGMREELLGADGQMAVQRACTSYANHCYDGLSLIAAAMQLETTDAPELLAKRRQLLHEYEEEMRGQEIEQEFQRLAQITALPKTRLASLYQEFQLLAVKRQVVPSSPLSAPNSGSVGRARRVLKSAEQVGDVLTALGMDRRLVALGKLLQIWDIDADGALDFGELVCGLTAFAESSTVDERVRLCFTTFDANDSGLLEFDEIANVLASPEWRAVLIGRTGTATVADVLSTHDTDTDGALSYDDVLAAVRRGGASVPSALRRGLTLTDGHLYGVGGRQKIARAVGAKLKDLVQTWHAPFPLPWVPSFVQGPGTVERTFASNASALQAFTPEVAASFCVPPFISNTPGNFLWCKVQENTVSRVCAQQYIQGVPGAVGKEFRAHVIGEPTANYRVICMDSPYYVLALASDDRTIRDCMKYLSLLAPTVSDVAWHIKAHAWLACSLKQRSQHYSTDPTLLSIARNPVQFVAGTAKRLAPWIARPKSPRVDQDKPDATAVADSSETKGEGVQDTANTERLIGEAATLAAACTSAEQLYDFLRRLKHCSQPHVTEIFAERLQELFKAWVDGTLDKQRLTTVQDHISEQVPFMDEGDTRWARVALRLIHSRLVVLTQAEEVALAATDPGDEEAGAL
eukprot:TRINITY_DN18133_c0_g1_i1.p1 TRINITY_DN18133_c0_g1~~TRINITY_DN18133_c0_g1_i1.p1  ORF type:complete len:875 (-),score=133.55 TRINITY_DN18133_c0_g1_i1:8-2584(-)